MTYLLSISNLVFIVVRVSVVVVVDFLVVLVAIGFSAVVVMDFVVVDVVSVDVVVDFVVLVVHFVVVVVHFAVVVMDIVVVVVDFVGAASKRKRNNCKKNVEYCFKTLSCKITGRCTHRSVYQAIS